MALKLDYALKETGANLRRNLTLTMATLLTVAVSLALAGSSILMRQAVDNATRQWRGGVEFIVWMNADDRIAIGLTRCRLRGASVGLEGAARRGDDHRPHPAGARPH